MIDTHIYQDGQWFKPITPKEAFDMRLDVQLYELNLIDKIVPDPDTPEGWREGRSKYTHHGPYNSFDSSYWRDPHIQWFIKVDPPDKMEYVPEQPSNEVATMMDRYEEELFEQDGVLYKRISGKEAFRIRKDIQLYSRCSDHVRPDIDSPEDYRKVWQQEYYHAGHAYWDANKFYVRVDTDKPEYEPGG